MPDQLRRRARVFQLVCGSTCEMVGGDVAHAIARSLDGMHADIGKRCQHVRYILQLRPVELDVLACREMAVALVPALGDIGKLPQLG